jgi:hypothetical protein
MKYFRIEEFACKCGCGLKYPSPALLSLLQKIRASLGEPVVIVSGWRCTLHNKGVGSAVLGKQGFYKGQCGDATASAHTRGEAADIYVRVSGRQVSGRQVSSRQVSSRQVMGKAQLYDHVRGMVERGEIPELEYVYMIKQSSGNIHVGVDVKARSSRFGGEQ